MAYQPVHDAIPQPDRTNAIELEERSDIDTSECPPSPTQPLNEDLEYDDPRQSFVRSTSPSIRSIKSGCPIEPRRLATFTPGRICLVVFDTVLASTPIMFIALAAIAARLDGEQVSAYGRKVEETLLLSPTIFPLIFAALMGRFFRHLGVYLAERGTTLGRVEQLVGCQSVFTALERQVTLRYWSIIGLFSILVWLLSPVGGQSALRLLSQESGEVTSTKNFRYMNPISMLGTAMSEAGIIEFSRADFTAIYLTALLSTSRYQDTPMDLWGNVKFPLYRSIEKDTPEEWKQMRRVPGSNATYGSLIGVPVVGMPSEGNSSFNIRARQFDVSCASSETQFHPKPPTRWENSTRTWKYVYNEGKYCQNYPCPVVYESLLVPPPGEDQLSRLNSPLNISVATCSLDYNYLEAKVICNGTLCGVESMRKLELLSDGYTTSQDSYTRRAIISNLLSTMPSVDNNRLGSSISERWIVNNTDFIGQKSGFAKLYMLDLEVLSRGLTILLNTFHQSTFATTALGGALPKDLAQDGQLAVVSNSDKNTIYTFNSTQANIVQESSAVYMTNWKWFIALLFSSLVLLVAAYAGLIFKYITLAPDIIGFASSLTMLNPYFQTPTGSTTLHGLERAALLHNLPVQIGDVCVDESVGTIAFAKADEGNVAKLDRRRLYI